MDDFIINVKQIGNYQQQPIGANDLMLAQQGGIGGPYICFTQDQLLGQVFQRLNVGILPAPDNKGIAASFLITPLGQRQGFNWYTDSDGVQRYLQGGPAGYWSQQNTAGNLVWAVAPPGEKDDPISTSSWTQIFDLTTDGSLTVGGIAISGPPTDPTDAVTMAWVQANTVASFNTRIGAVTLTLADVTGAGGAPLASPTFTGIPHAPSPTTPTQSDTQVATTAWVHTAITAATSAMSFVDSFNGRQGAVTLALADVTGAGGAPIVSPAFTGVPTAPTPASTDNSTAIATTAFVDTNFPTKTFVSSTYAPINSPTFTGTPTAPTALAGDSSGSLATTAFVHAAVVASTTGVSSFNTRTGAVTLNLADVENAGGAPIASPSFTGVPLAPEPAPGNNTGQIATTAWVTSAIAAATAGVASWNGSVGSVTMTAADVTGVGGALLASPAFSGTPTAPTQSPGNSTTALATTAFVTAAVAGFVTSFNSRTGAITLQSTDVSAAGGALVAGPTFTGVPSAPTAAPGTSTTQLATTAFVAAAVGAAGGVTTFNGRGGAVSLQISDVTGVGGAPLNSPIFTGTPASVTAAPGNNSTAIATTAFVTAAIAAMAVVTTFNTRSGAVTFQAADLSAVGGALLAGPAFTGVPTAPTATAGTNTTQIATTQFVTSAIPTTITSNNVIGANTDFTGAITLAATDSGRIKNCTAAGAVVVTLPNNMAVNFYVTIIQRGAGIITFNAASGATLTQRQAMYRTAGQYAMCTLVVSANAGGAAASYTLAGDLQV